MLSRKKKKDAILRAKSKGIRKRSGRVNCDDPLVLFLYLLSRDKVPSGTIETILGQVEQAQKQTPIAHTNGWLARWAKDAAKRLGT